MIIIIIVMLIASYLTVGFVFPNSKIGIIIVDHGSKVDESNRKLIEVVDIFKRAYNYAIVEPAHMELAEPSVATAYGKCVEQGAQRIICHPYFLSRGRHVQHDIPARVLSASHLYPQTTFIITEPLGVQEQLVHLIKYSIDASMGPINK